MAKNRIFSTYFFRCFLFLLALGLPSCTQTIIIQKEAPPSVVTPDSSKPDSSDILKQKIEHAKSKVFPALVTIQSFTEGYANGRKVKGTGVGSGTILDQQGYVITNAHVTRSGKKFNCVLSNKEVVSATLIGEDFPTDLSVLKLHLNEAKSFDPIPVAQFGKSSEANSGDVVLAMGSPFSLTRTLTMGIISNPYRRLTRGGLDDGLLSLGRFRSGQYTNWIQHDASINPGNSGGPLVNLEGLIIGINQLKGPGDDIGYAIPSKIAKKVYQELIRYGRVRRSHLGFNCAPIYETDEEQGILVINVEESSAASKAGLQPGDFILTYNTTSVTARYLEDLPPFYRMASEIPVGQKIDVWIKRSGEKKKISFVTQESENDWGEEKEFRAWGMTAANISPLLQRNARLSSREGVYVTGVRGLAQRIRPSILRHVITEVGGVKIKDLEDFKKVYKNYAQRKKKYSLPFGYTDGANSYLGVLKYNPASESNLQEVKRPWLGVNTQVFVTDFRKALKFDKKVQGVRVVRIFPNTLAEKSDLQVGDIITRVGDKPVKAYRESHTQIFPTLLSEHEVGEVVSFEVMRGKEKMTIDIELEATPREPRYAQKARDNDFEFGVRDITFFDIVGQRWDKEIKGLIVTDIENNGWVSGKLGRGDLILSIENEDIVDIKGFKNLMERIKKEKTPKVKFLVRRNNSTIVTFVEPEWEG